jgi:hypothetical protein
MAADAAHAPESQPKAKIFISYSRKDMELADRLEATLKARDFEVLIDRQEIYAFEDWCNRPKRFAQERALIASKKKRRAFRKSDFDCLVENPSSRRRQRPHASFVI